MSDQPASSGETTRAALLDAAAQVFAEQGFAGSSVRDITTLAGVNLAAITYHFGSKASLWEAVLVRAQSQMLEELERAAWRSGTTLQRLEALLRAHFGFLSDHPHFRRLIMQVLLSTDAIPETAASYLRRILGLFTALVAKGQSEGTIRKGDPLLLTIAVVSQSFMLNLLRAPLKAGPNIDLDDPAVRADALENALRFVRAGLVRPSGREA